jgi:hypothetical protein
MKTGESAPMFVREATEALDRFEAFRAGFGSPVP